MEEKTPMTPEATKAALEQKFADVQIKLQDLQTSKEATEKELETAKDSIIAQGNALQEFIDAQEKEEKDSFDKQLNTFFKEKSEDIENVYKKGSGYVEFIPKVVGDMSTALGTDNTPPANHNTSLSNINLRNDQALIGLTQSFNTSSASFAYTEVVPKDGDYAFVAEGVSKPQMDFDWNVRYAEPVKIAAHMILTEEVVKDIPRMESVAKDYLRKKHDLFKADGLYFGPGTAGTAKGATVYGRVFSAGAMATAVQTPNFLDVINACIVDIYTTHNYTDESSYSPNVALVSPTDFFLNLVAAKDVNGKPLFPQASLFNQVNFGGVIIRPWAKVPAGKVFVADMKKYNITSWVPYSVRIGWINDQFITNKFTMVGESRFHAFVRNLDEQAFIYDDIATIKTAITAI